MGPEKNSLASVELRPIRYESRFKAMLGPKHARLGHNIPSPQW
jgi:hypothetical protein